MDGAVWRDKETVDLLGVIWGGSMCAGDVLGLGRVDPLAGIARSLSSISAGGAKGPFRLGRSRFSGSVIVRGGVSLESIRPIASMAPPSISVRSLIVIDCGSAGFFRSGEREGRLGENSGRLGADSGDEDVLMIVGRELLVERGDKRSGEVSWWSVTRAGGLQCSALI